MLLDIALNIITRKTKGDATARNSLQIRKERAGLYEHYCPRTSHIRWEERRLMPFTRTAKSSLFKF